MWLLWIPFLAIIPWLPLPQQIQQITFPITLVLILMLSLRRVEKQTFSYSQILWGIFAIWVLLRTNSAREFAPTAWGEAVLILALVWLGPPKINASNLTRITILVAAVAVFAKWVLGDVLFYQYSPFNQENHYALFLYFSFGCGVYSITGKEQKSWHENGLLFTGIIVSSLAIFFTGAKAIQLAWLAMVGVTGLLQWKKIRNVSPKFIFHLIALALLIITIGIPFWASNQAPLGSNSSLLARQDIWKASFVFLQDHWSVGIGWHEFGARIAEVYPDRFHAYWPYEMYPSGAHNLWLHIWSELGVIGFVLLFSAILAGVISLWGRLKEENFRGPAILFGIYTGYCIILATTHAGYGFPSSLLILLLFSLAMDRSEVFVIHKLQERWRIGIPMLFALLLLGTSALQYRILSAESMVSPIFINHQVRGMEDVNLLQKSLEYAPNSIASFYASGVFLQNGEWDAANHYVELTETLSGFRWPIAQRKFEIGVKEKGCASLRDLAESIWKKTPKGEASWVLPESATCFKTMVGNLPN